MDVRFTPKLRRRISTDMNRKALPRDKVLARLRRFDL